MAQDTAMHVCVEYSTMDWVKEGILIGAYLTFRGRIHMEMYRCGISERLRKGGRLLVMTAALVLALFTAGFTPSEQDAFDTNADLVMTIEVTHTSQADLDKSATMFDQESFRLSSWYRQLPLNTTESRSYTMFTGTDFEQYVHDTVTFTTIGGLQAVQDWLLPTYLPPDATDQVYVISKRVHTKKGADLAYSSMCVAYSVELSGTKYHIAYTAMKSDGVYEIPLPQIILLPGEEAETVNVFVNEALATAVKRGITSSWEMQVWQKGMMITISTNLPLTELINIVESLPTLN